METAFQGFRLGARGVAMLEHREACATPSESLGKPPFRSSMRPVGGHHQGFPTPSDGPHGRSLWVFITTPWYQANLPYAGPP